MVVLPLKTRARQPRSKVATVIRCYSVFERFFPACGLLDYTEGLYDGDPTTPLEIAQRNQIEYVLDEAGCAAGTRVLEIGCGNGTLLDAARERGAEAVGITISPEQVARCRQRGLDVRLLNYVDLDEQWTHRFDAVIANGPIEHFVQPEDASAGRADTIYRQFFELCHRAIDPKSSVRRLVTTTIHFVRSPDPRDLLKPPYEFPRGSDNFHWAMLARSFGGWYPALGQFERCARGRFAPVAITDGTYDYHLTSEEWLRRMRGTFATSKGWRLLAKALPCAIRHPLQTLTMFACMLGSESWNWQFRGPCPPTKLLRHTWAY
jgi:cyclopropane fatty-acyl-phospholipid synthase-like methyltransferase